MVLKLCSICLKESIALKSVKSKAENNVKLITKLQKLAPDQEWLTNYLICLECETLLNNSYRFREMCIKFEHRRKELITEQLKETAIFDELGCSENTVINPESDNDNTSINDCSKQEVDLKELKHLDCNTSVEKTDILTKRGKTKPKYICAHCNEAFHSKKSLNQHLKSQHYQGKNPNKFQCEICGENFSLLKNILSHCVSAHSMEQKNIKAYSCDICSSRFATSGNLIQHKKYHEGNRMHMCLFCGKAFNTKRDLGGHEKSHYNQRKYKCEQCEKSFNTSQNLRTHIYCVHTDPSEWKYSCTTCSKRFPLKTNFNEHLKRHQGDRTYTCHICKKSFISKHELQRHVRLHSNIKPHHCPECLKEYRDKRSLLVHLTKAHGVGTCKASVRVKKFVCHVCPSQFFDKTKLVRHERTHTGVKPYGCHGCIKRFSDKSYLTRHLKSVHNLKDPGKIQEYSYFLEEYLS